MFSRIHKDIMVEFFYPEAIPKNEKADWDFSEEESESDSEDSTSESEGSTRPYIISTITDKYTHMIKNCKSKILKQMLSECIDLIESHYFGDMLCEKFDQNFNECLKTPLTEYAQETF